MRGSFRGLSQEHARRRQEALDSRRPSDLLSWEPHPGKSGSSCRTPLAALRLRRSGVQRRDHRAKPDEPVRCNGVLGSRRVQPRQRLRDLQLAST
jgi:hypothetical protein